MIVLEYPKSLMTFYLDPPPHPVLTIQGGKYGISVVQGSVISFGDDPGLPSYLVVEILPSAVQIIDSLSSIPMWAYYKQIANHPAWSLFRDSINHTGWIYVNGKQTT